MGQESTLVMSKAKQPGSTSHSKKAEPLVVYQASYEDFARVKIAAKKEGATDDDSFLDYVEPEQFQTYKTFRKLDEAVEWLKAEVNAMKTCFGAGDIYAIEHLGSRERCTYCTCRGTKPIHRYVVTDAGIESDGAVDDCAWDDDD